MIKKDYQKPTMKVVLLQQRTHILAGSGPETLSGHAKIDSMKSDLNKTRAEHLRWQQRYKQEPFEDYPYYVAETRWDAEVRNRLNTK